MYIDIYVYLVYLYIQDIHIYYIYIRYIKNNISYVYSLANDSKVSIHMITTQVQKGNFYPDLDGTNILILIFSLAIPECIPRQYSLVLSVFKFYVIDSCFVQFL